MRTYDTNKTSKFFINDFDWEIGEKNFGTRVQTKFISNIRNINYETKNINEFKSDTTNEVFGALGILSKIDLYKKVKNVSEHFDKILC